MIALLSSLLGIIKGPPESPGHAPLSSTMSKYPAQTMFFEIPFAISTQSPHFELVCKGLIKLLPLTDSLELQELAHAKAMKFLLSSTYTAYILGYKMVRGKLCRRRHVTRIARIEL